MTKQLVICNLNIFKWSSMSHWSIFNSFISCLHNLSCTYWTFWCGVFV